MLKKGEISMNKALLYIESELSNYMLAGGLPANLQGFQFLKESVMEVVKDPSLMQQLTKKLYPMIAERHHINAAVVERSMRHAVDVAYRSQSLYGLNDMLQAPFFINNEKPCNGTMIALFAEMIKTNLFKMIATADERNSGNALTREVQEFLDKYYGDDQAG